jgi:hypothetical protein
MTGNAVTSSPTVAVVAVVVSKGNYMIKALACACSSSSTYGLGCEEVILAHVDPVATPAGRSLTTFNR